MWGAISGRVDLWPVVVSVAVVVDFPLAVMGFFWISPFFLFVLAVSMRVMRVLFGGVLSGSRFLVV